MKYIKLTLQYMYQNIWYVLLFAIVPSLLLGFLTNPASNMEFIRDFANLHTFSEIFSSMSELNLKNFLIALPVFPVLLVIFSAASGIISKHMRRGIFNFNKFFRSVNNNIMYTLVVGFSLLAAFELAALLNASLATLWIKAFGNGRVGLTLSILTICVSWVILLLIATVSLLWLPTMSVTGLNPAKALAESFRNLKGKIWKVLFAIALPLLFYFVICAPLSYFVVPGRQVVYTLVYLFMLPYALILMFTVYCEVNDIDREDLRLRAFRKQGIINIDIADDDKANLDDTSIESESFIATDIPSINYKEEPKDIKSDNNAETAETADNVKSDIGDESEIIETLDIEDNSIDDVVKEKSIERNAKTSAKTPKKNGGKK